MSQRQHFPFHGVGAQENLYRVWRHLVKSRLRGPGQEPVLLRRRGLLHFGEFAGDGVDDEAADYYIGGDQGVVYHAGDGFTDGGFGVVEALQPGADAIGTNRTYLSQHFAQQGITYNSYINGLRIRHFIRLHQEAVAQQRVVTAQQLAIESGFHSYSTFSTTFKQHTGATVAAWMHGAGK